jgi:hypothetical protein
VGRAGGRRQERGAHRRIDGGSGRLLEREAIDRSRLGTDDERILARSVTLSAERLGLITRLDGIEIEDGDVPPVDDKRGRLSSAPAIADPPGRAPHVAADERSSYTYGLTRQIRCRTSSPSTAQMSSP